MSIDSYKHKSFEGGDYELFNSSLSVNKVDIPTIE